MSLEMKTPHIESATHVDRVEIEPEINPKEASNAQWLPIDEAWRAREKKLVRKLDLTLMPTIWVLYLFNYLDRNNIAYVLLCFFGWGRASSRPLGRK